MNVKDFQISLCVFEKKEIENFLKIYDINTLQKDLGCTPIQYCSAISDGPDKVKFLLQKGADPLIKDLTGRDALDIARHLKNEETIKVLEEFYSKIKVEKKELDEMKQFLLSKIDELKKDHEKEIKEIKNEQKEFRYQMLTERVFIKDEDLKMNIPLKKKNCFLVKDVQKAKDLGGITSMKDLERVIENDEYQDVFEIKNTLNCLEGVVEEWKNGKLKVDDLDQALEFKIEFDEWKSKDQLY